MKKERIEGQWAFDILMSLIVICILSIFLLGYFQEKEKVKLESVFTNSIYQYKYINKKDYNLSKLNGKTYSKNKIDLTGLILENSITIFNKVIEKTYFEFYKSNVVKIITHNFEDRIVVYQNLKYQISDNKKHITFYENIDKNLFVKEYPFYIKEKSNKYDNFVMFKNNIYLVKSKNENYFFDNRFKITPIAKIFKISQSLKHYNNLILCFKFIF